MAAVADAKGIHPHQIDVQIGRETVEGVTWRTRFAVHVDLGPGLTRRERAILYNSARRCEVHKLLEGQASFDYRLVEGDPDERVTEPSKRPFRQGSR